MAPTAIAVVPFTFAWVPFGRGVVLCAFAVVPCARFLYKFTSINLPFNKEKLLCLQEQRSRLGAQFHRAAEAETK